MFHSDSQINFGRKFHLMRPCAIFGGQYWKSLGQVIIAIGILHNCIYKDGCPPNRIALNILDNASNRGAWLQFEYIFIRQPVLFRRDRLFLPGISIRGNLHIDREEWPLWKSQWDDSLLVRIIGPHDKMQLSHPGSGKYTGFCHCSHACLIH